METFDFPFHLYETEYPDSGYRMTMGNAYSYATEPTGPDQRLFTLTFKTMKYFQVGGVLDATVEPFINLMRLENFYQAHRLWRNFIYPHPIYGNVVVKFQKPLKTPKGIEQGGGATASFSIELIEQP